MAKDTKPASKLDDLAKLGAAAVAAATALLYAAGYLSLRHHLNALGVDVPLEVVDERYLFAGARCLEHFLAAVPHLVLLLFVPGLLAALLVRRVPRLRTGLAALADAVGRGPVRPALCALAVSTLAVQLVMRQPLALSDLLLREALPRPEWLQSLLLDAAGTWLTLYLGGILTLTGISAVLGYAAWRRLDSRPGPRFLVGLVGVVVTFQALLLPVNYGVLTAGREVPRVAFPGLAAGIGENDQAWLVWETTERLLLLARAPDPWAFLRGGQMTGDTKDGVLAPGERRRIVSLDRDQAGPIETLCVDSLLRVLYRDEESCGGRGQE